ncbi:MAG: glycosyltransferase family 4 protein [Clostridia bacterium]|nr:glycosyltransferase family 4 protein [Clostridia bacterium]
MNKIAVVANDVAMPGEKGLGRLYYLCDLLSKNGFETELITADFQHWEKRYRSAEHIRHVQNEALFKITFLHELSYKKNIEPKRIISYRVLAKNAKRYLSENRYDLIYALIPDNHLACVAGAYAKQTGVPFVIDVEDLWPEAMRMVFDVPVASDLLFSYFTVNAKKAYSFADAVVGSSDEYRDEPLKYGVAVPQGKTVYVGNDLSSFDRSVAEMKDAVKKPEGEFWVTYAGTIGASYDLGTLVRAADLLAKRGLNDIRILILGDGPQRAELEEAAKKTAADIRFTGFLPFAEMAAYLYHSDVTVNSLVEKAPQSIVSKIGDYLAAGVPMINTGLNNEFCKKVEADGFGVNIVPGNAELLADCIVDLFHSPEKRKAIGKKARMIAEAQFDRGKTYQGIIELIQSLL